MDLPPTDLHVPLKAHQDIEGLGPGSARPEGHPTKMMCFCPPLSLLAVSWMSLAAAMTPLEPLWIKAGDSLTQKVQEALDWAQWFFDEENYMDENGKEQKRNPYNLLKDEIAAIVIYTMEFDVLCLYKELNRLLRSQSLGSELQPFLAYLKLLLTALYKLPTRKMQLYRGIKPGDKKLHYECGDVTTFGAFSSATPSLGVLNKPEFLGKKGKRIAFRINGRGTDISFYSWFGAGEDERLVEAGASFKVGNTLNCGHNLEFVELEEIIDSQSCCFDFAPPANRIRLDVEEEKAQREEVRMKERREWQWYAKICIGTAIICTTMCFIIFHQVFIREAGQDWERKFPNLNVSVSGPAAVNGSNGGNDGYAIWLLGGFIYNKTTQTTQPSNQVQVYDRTSWSIHSRMPVELGSHAVVWWNNCLVVTGGFDLSEHTTNHVLKMCNNMEWERWINMSFSRAGHGSAIYQDKIYVIGGDQQGNQVEYFDPDAHVWKSQIPMRESRWRSFATVVYKERLFALGGTTLGVEYFNGSTWTDTTPMKVTAHSTGINAVVFDEKIYVFGSSVVEQGKWLRDANALSWEIKRQATSFWLPGQLYMASCVLHDDQYWAMGGGYRNTPPSDKVWTIYLEKLNPNWIYSFFYTPWE